MYVSSHAPVGMRLFVVQYQFRFPGSREREQENGAPSETAANG